MGDERPSDALQPAAKKRAGGARDRDDLDDDTPSVDPGSWIADASATRERRKVHVRRGAGVAATQATQGEQAASANPFAGIALSLSAAATANQPPPEQAQAPTPAEVASAPADADKEAAEGVQAAEVKAADTTAEGGEHPVASTSAPCATTTPTPSIFGGSAGTTSGFASLAAGGTSFGGFGGGAIAGGSTTGGLFGSSTSGGIFGQGILGGGSLFGSTTGTGGFGGGFSFPKLETAGASLGQRLFGGTGGGAEEGGEGEEGAEPFEPSEDPSIKPVVQLPPIQKVTGEENEDTIYAEQGKLYEYDSAASKWLERGNGELRVNVSKDGSWSRMLMRQSGNLHLKLNARVTATMPVQRMQGANGVTFSCVNTAAATDASQQQAAPADAKAEGDEAAGGSSKAGVDLSRTWAFRTKGEEKVLALLAALERAKQMHCKRQDMTGSGKGGEEDMKSDGEEEEEEQDGDDEEEDAANEV
ncbi:hypothetical protein Vretimale_8760 [Volvox reticuliferus]|uniref:RanBD1 domain-containing protein n=2 Tax=Volvox reticuliferus TaxID=1737510 RepID=A0A8J4GC67_9CHLO|nr:hypothetical protein Vretimale_8760 [Volvox reticuliferus]